jgi:hypothetical protein
MDTFHIYLDFAALHGVKPAAQAGARLTRPAVDGSSRDDGDVYWTISIKMILTPIKSPPASF